MWREGLGCYKILTEDKKGYRNHPAVKEFDGYLIRLWGVLHMVRMEMIKRGYNPKEMPSLITLLASRVSEFNTKNGRIFFRDCSHDKYKPWQTLEEQIEVLQSKHCDCKV
jgi:hypothetical protein